MRQTAKDMVGMAKSPRKNWGIILIVIFAIYFIGKGGLGVGDGFIDRFMAAGEAKTVELAAEPEGGWDNEGVEPYYEELSPKQMVMVDRDQREMSYKEKRLEKIANATNRMINSFPDLLLGLAALIGAIATYRKSAGA